MMDEETAFMIATGKVVQKIRKQLGMLVSELSDKSGVDQLKIELIEKGSMRADILDLVGLAAGLRTKVVRLTEKIAEVAKELVRDGQGGAS